MRKRAALGIVGAAWLAALVSCGAEDETTVGQTEETSGVQVLPQMGHADSVYAVAFSPDGRLAASASSDNTVKLWDVATGREIRNFNGDADRFRAVAFSPDGRFLVSGNYHGNGPALRLWDVASGKRLQAFEATSVTAVAFSHDGRFILSGHWDWRVPLILWDATTGKQLRKFVEHPGGISSVAFSPDGRFALSGSRGGSRGDPSMKLWDVATGAELRRFSMETGGIAAVAFSTDGRFALSASTGRDTPSGGIWPTVALWDLTTGRRVHSYDVQLREIDAVAFSPDGRTFVAAGSGRYSTNDSAPSLSLWDVATGRMLRGLDGHRSTVSSAIFSPDGRLILSGSLDNTLRLWNASTGAELRNLSGRMRAVQSVAFSPDGRLALTGGDKRVHLWDTATGKRLHTFSTDSDIGGTTFWPGGYVRDVAFSADGRVVIVGTSGGAKLWDVATGRNLDRVERRLGSYRHVVFSPDGRLAATGASGGVNLWEVATGKYLRLLPTRQAVRSMAFSSDGRRLLIGGYGALMQLWDVATGKEVRSFETRNSIGNANSTAVALSPDGGRALSGGNDRRMILWNAQTGRELRRFTDRVSWQDNIVAFSRDGQFVLGSGGPRNDIVVWHAATGRKLHSFKEHAGSVTSVDFSPDGRFLLSGSKDGTARLWSMETGREVARLMATPDDEWVTVTPEGFFSSSHRETDFLTIARGVEVTTIGQVHQSLFNPDLLREALAGDPDGEVKRAAKVANLDKVLDAGPPPTVAITSHRPGSRSNAGLVSVAARITDHGKGVGRIEWRVNGVTAGVSSVRAGTGPVHQIKRTLALDPGKNLIEVIAYEAHNLLASRPARTTILFKGPADAVKPELHVLAIGINAYEDKGGPAEAGRFPPLSLAVADAKTFAAEMQKAGAGLYAETRVTTALDAQAAAASLERIFEQVSDKVDPRDTFVLYAAAHGVSHNGRFYLIPQDYQGGNDREALAARAIGQERLQDWIANRIKAKKAVILLDTCESGALVSGYTKSRTDTPASEAAIGRLHEATGRPVLTAAASGKPAFEGYNGHGVFTYALMDALHHGDSSGNGMIELTELVSHVQRLVPKLSAELNGRGVSIAALRGFKDDKQSARFGSTGEDFALVRRLP